MVVKITACHAYICYNDDVVRLILKPSMNNVLFPYIPKFTWSLCVIFITTSAFASNMPSSTTSYIEGQDYIRLPSEMRSNGDVQELILDSPLKVQVLLFFSYGCPACARFDPFFEKWVETQKNNKVVIYRIPVSFKEEWLPLAKLYYITQYLKPKKNIDEKIYEAIHTQHLQLWLQPEMKNFLVANGYTSIEFDNAYNSFNVNMKLKNAEQLSKAYGINQTPSIIVNGPIYSYLLTISKSNSNLDDFFKIVNYVISKEEKNGP